MMSRSRVKTSSISEEGYYKEWSNLSNQRLVEDALSAGRYGYVEKAELYAIIDVLAERLSRYEHS